MTIDILGKMYYIGWVIGPLTPTHHEEDNSNDQRSTVDSALAETDHREGREMTTYALVIERRPVIGGDDIVTAVLYRNYDELNPFVVTSFVLAKGDIMLLEDEELRCIATEDAFVRAQVVV